MEGHILRTRNEKAPKAGKTQFQTYFSRKNQETDNSSQWNSTFLMLGFLKKSVKKMTVFAFSSPLKQNLARN